MTSQHNSVMTSLKIFRHFDFFFRILIKDISKKYCGKFEVNWLKIKEFMKRAASYIASKKPSLGRVKGVNEYSELFAKQSFIYISTF